MEFAVIDLETTGLFPAGHDRIVEIGVVRVDEHGEILGTLDTLVNPSRDAGPTRIHGIEAWELDEAPTFPEIIGDLLAMLDGAIVVAHNASFDTRFLNAELQRAGYPNLTIDAFCTMELVYSLYPGAPRRLGDCCRHFGVPSRQAHRALTDAQMAADLLIFLLHQWRYPALPQPIHLDIYPIPSRHTHPRGATLHVTERQCHYLAELVAKLPGGSPVLTASAQGSQYLNLLDRVFEDRRLTEDEAQLLILAADTFGLGRDEVHLLHRHYLTQLVELALADEVVTQAERADLEAVAAILGLGPLDSFTSAGSSRAELRRDLDHPAPVPSGLATTGFDTGATTLPPGTTVCFTGAMDHADRPGMEHLAASHGLIIKPGVSHKLDVLVVGDPETQSGKARKAREYGTRIMSEFAFLRALGIGQTGR